MKKLFTDGADTYVAETVEEVLDDFRALIGDDYVGEGYGEKSDWYTIEDDKPVRIFFDTGHEPPIIPEGASVEEDGEFVVIIKAPASAWAIAYKRGFLCSS